MPKGNSPKCNNDYFCVLGFESFYFLNYTTFSLNFKKIIKKIQYYASGIVLCFE